MVIATQDQHVIELPHAIGYLTMLVGLSLVFGAIKRHRDAELGGVIRFWPAFGLGLGVSFVASLCYVLAWEARAGHDQLRLRQHLCKRGDRTAEGAGREWRGAGKLVAKWSARGRLREPGLRLR